MSPSIAIVEDETHIAMALTHVLRRAGFQTGHLDDGGDVLSALKAAPPDLVLLDVQLPGRSGYDICQQMRMDPDFDDTRILMMTASGGALERRKSLALGADDFMLKPFELDDLVARVRALTGFTEDGGADDG